METKTIIKITVLSIAGLVAAATMYDGFARVQEGTRGVDLTFGAADPTPLEPGLHLKAPWVTKVRSVDIKQRKFEQGTQASTRDQQTVLTTVAVNYHADASHAVDIYSTLGNESATWDAVIIAPQIQETLKSITAQYTALELITKRTEVKGKITSDLTERIAAEHFSVVQVSVTDFQFSEVYRQAIEAKQVAEQEAQRAANELERNALDVQKIEQQAEAEKTAAITKAEGEAEALRIKAQAEADFHSIISETATPQSLRNREIGRWDGKTPLYVGNEGASVLLPGDSG